VHKREGKDVGSYVKLWRLFRALRPTIVHTRNLGTIDAAFPAKLAGVRRLVHGEHGWEINDIAGTNAKYMRLRRICSRLIDKQIAVSCNLADWLRTCVGVSATRIEQIYNGVDTTVFRPAVERRSPLPISAFAGPDEFVVGTVGRMAPIKDPLLLARAFRTLRQAGAHRVRLAMVGDGPLLEDVKRFLAEEEAANLTWLPGRRDDIDAVLRGLDLFILPSRNEGISNTILEAMATGLPVVATDVGGNPELVVAGTGMLVRAEDPDAMAAAIGRYVADPQLARTHGAEGRRRVLEHFSMDAMLERYLAVYDALTDSEPGISRA
jgi:sugar transferase (PEP-CTERM/EpsH1 system associated)